MATQKKGNFVIMNAKGNVAMAGRAEVVNSTPSAGVSDVSEIQKHKDSVGITRTWTRDGTAYELTLTITPGIGGTNTAGTSFASTDALKAVSELVPLGSQLITKDFAVECLNWPAGYYAQISSSSVGVSAGGLLTQNITARRECVFIGGVETPINFTGAWADL